ncbi:MAG TPA: HNH endonuclease family protein, partial [Ktedonobacteraceae bacterium]
LLRLDASLSEGIATYDYHTVSVEHVLPQRPSIDSEWASIFPTREIREKYVHKLGNLLLLSRGKNIRAENYDFEYKKQYYFSTANGISPFVLTTQVLRYQQWTSPIIEQRQVQMVNTAKKLWRL